MKLALFSDLHIKNKQDSNYINFLKDLDSLPSDIDYLIFLGDIFNFLYGNVDWLIKEYSELFNKLETLNKRGIKLYYVFGNHDFNFHFLTINYINIAERFLLNVGEKRIFLLHGDGIGEKDSVYKLLKAILRSKFFFYLYLLFPRVVIYKLANFFAYISRILGKRKSKRDVCRFYRGRARSLAKKNKADVVFMGHSHIKDYLKTKSFEYVNVGEFEQNGFYIYQF